MNDRMFVIFVVIVAVAAASGCTQPPPIESPNASESIPSDGYNFVVIAETGTLSVGGRTVITLSSGRPSLNNYGQVAFLALLRPTLGGDVQHVLVGDGGEHRSLADSDGSIDRFDDVALNDNEDFAYLATMDAGNPWGYTNALFSRRGGLLASNASSTASLYKNFGNFGAFHEVEINNNGSIAFSSSRQQSNDVEERAYVLGEYSTPWHVCTSNCRFVDINDSATVVAGLRRKVRGGVEVDLSTTLPPVPAGAAGQTRTIGEATLDGSDRVTLPLSYSGSGGSYLLRSSGASTASVLDDSLDGNVTRFDSVAANDAGAYACRVQDGGGRSVFTGSDSVSERLISEGDSLFGQTVAEVGEPAINELGQVALYVRFADALPYAHAAIVRADCVGANCSQCERERCDTIDNDCDGLTDEGNVCNTPALQSADPARFLVKDFANRLNVKLTGQKLQADTQVRVTVGSRHIDAYSVYNENANRLDVNFSAIDLPPTPEGYAFSAFNPGSDQSAPLQWAPEYPTAVVQSVRAGRDGTWVSPGRYPVDLLAPRIDIQVTGTLEYLGKLMFESVDDNGAPIVLEQPWPIATATAKFTFSGTNGQPFPFNGQQVSVSFVWPDGTRSTPHVLRGVFPDPTMEVASPQYLTVGQEPEVRLAGTHLYASRFPTPRRVRVLKFPPQGSAVTAYSFAPTSIATDGTEVRFTLPATVTSQEGRVDVWLDLFGPITTGGYQIRSIGDRIPTLTTEPIEIVVINWEGGGKTLGEDLGYRMEKWVEDPAYPGKTFDLLGMNELYSRIVRPGKGLRPDWYIERLKVLPEGHARDYHLALVSAGASGRKRSVRRDVPR